MRVAGIMSGTSLDGIDVAIVDIARKRGGVRVTPVAFRSTPYPKLVREAILAVSNSMTHTATIARLNFLLGELYAGAVQETCRRRRISMDSIVLLGMHGQTIFHESEPVEYLGHRIASTLQIGFSEENGNLLCLTKDERNRRLPACVPLSPSGAHPAWEPPQDRLPRQTQAA